MSVKPGYTKPHRGAPAPGKHVPSAWDNGGSRNDTSGVLMTTAALADATTFDVPHNPRIRYRQGDSRFIIELMRQAEDGLPMGQVADLEWGHLFAPMPLGSILARGYWQEMPEPIAAMGVLAEVRPVG